ncbi:hypothetical protein Q4I32_008314 [Leishmania shawi]|uniref:Uncharacterized protein n=1 Tax=Leishmania shawi TaxID=5680 RepID=A0AAW3B5E6_9TRYP
MFSSEDVDAPGLGNQRWDSNPFYLVEKDRNPYSRGTWDAKGFLAVALPVVPTVLEVTHAKSEHWGALLPHGG